MTYKAPFLLVIVYAVLAVGCIDLSLPDNVVVVCREDVPASCPPGFACQVALGVCVQEEALDTSPPTGGMELTPRLARAGVFVDLHIQVSEPLVAPAEVALRLPGGERLFDVDDATYAPGGLDYQLRYRVQGDEPEGEDLEIHAFFRDTAGLTGTASTTVQFDFTAPPGPATTGPEALVFEFAPAGTRESVGTAVRNVVVPPQATTTEGDVLVLRRLPGAIAFAEAAAPTTAEVRIPLDEGITDVFASLRDAAGNESDAVRIERFDYVGLLTQSFVEDLPVGDMRLLPNAELGPLVTSSAEAVLYRVSVGGAVVQRLEAAAIPPVSETAVLSDLARGEVWLLGGSDFDVGETSDRAFVWNGDGWTERPTNMPQRGAHAVAWDPHTGDTVLLAGGTGVVGEAVADSWRKRGPFFEQDSSYISAAGADDNGQLLNFELRCRNHVAAFDPARQDTIVVHGCPHDQHVDGAQWERIAGEWRIIAPPDPEGDGNPEMRDGSTLTADVTRRRLILFGGSSRFLDDPTSYEGVLWEWNGTSWLRAAEPDPTGATAPAPRKGAFAAWDPLAGRVLVGGGFRRIDDVTIEHFTDLWSWDGASWQRLPDAPGPGRVEASAGFHPAHNQLIVVGGAFGADARDTLVFENGTWRVVTPSGAAPPARTVPAMLTFGDDVLLASGSGGNDAHLWRFDGRWTELGTLDVGAVSGASLVDADGTAWLVGGDGETDIRALLDIEADVIPTLLIGSIVDDTPAQEVAYGFDPVRARLWAVGGYRNGVYDAGSWFFHGRGWTSGGNVFAPTAQAFSTRLVFDAQSDGLLVYSRCVDSGADCSTWWQSPAGWTEPAQNEDPEGPPDVRGGAVLVVDEGLQAPLLIAGDSREVTDGFTDEIHLWHDTRWHRLPLHDGGHTGRMTTLVSGGGAFHRGSQRTVVFGGSRGGFGAPRQETWTIDSLRDERPGVLLRFDLDEAAAPALVTDGAEGGSLTLVAGARSVDESDAPLPGYEVRAWNGARWVAVGSADSDVTATSASTFALSAELMTTSMVGRVVVLEVIPLGRNGVDRGRIHVQEAEFLLRTRLR